MTIAHTYQLRRDEAAAIVVRALELAAVADADDRITAHRLRLMADLGLEIVKSTEQRIRDLAAAGEKNVSDLHTAGPALDAEICRVVFGLRVEAEPLVSGAVAYGVWGQNPHRPAEVSGPLPYSDDTSYGWSVMRSLLLRMQELGWHARLTTPFEAGDLYFAGFTPLGMSGWNGRPDHEAGAESLPLAACLASLKAVAAGVNGPLSEPIS